MTTKQHLVFKLADRLLRPYPGYNGTCCDEFKALNDSEIEKIGLRASVYRIVDDTLYWMGYFHGAPTS